MSGQKISDSFLGNLINRSVGAALSDVIPLATDLVEARAEIARLTAERDEARAHAIMWAERAASEIGTADEAVGRYDALLAERAGVGEAKIKSALVEAGWPYFIAGKLAEGAGTLPSYIQTDEVVRVLVAALATPIQPASPPPDWDGIRDLAPHATGSLSSEDFVRELRDDWGATPIPTSVDREAIRSAAKTEASR